MEIITRLRAKKNIKWENWGRLVTVIQKGDIVKIVVRLSEDNLTVTSASAYSPYAQYHGVRDQVDLSDFEEFDF